ncbi:hypothetical protein [Rufibacter immobilis]|nr:hypothetical protein [Rufibacter immobilis]
MPQVSLFWKALPIVSPFMVFMGWLTWQAQDNGFFWDNILLASKYGQWYYQTRFSTLFVPEELAGYPPLFGMYIAAGWHLCGKSLPVSHFLMLPFLLGIVWQVYLLVQRFVASRVWLMLGMLLVFLDPTLLAQSTQVAPDLALLFLYLICLNALLRHQSLPLATALVCMALLSPRSQLLLPAVYLTQLFLQWQESKTISFQIFIRNSKVYLPAAFLLCLWLGLHYWHYGWVGFSRTSDWGEYAAFVSPTGFLRNVGLIGWRLLDFGRIALWFTAAVLLWHYRKHLSSSTQQLLVLLLVPLITQSLVLVWFTNPIAHRYWLIIYVLLGILTTHLLEQMVRLRVKQAIYLVLVVSLLSGHFWLYPPKIAKGWDATLAHWPYFELRREMLAYLDQRQIKWSQVGSDFPNLAAPADTDLASDRRQLSAKDFATQPYILYSNVLNSFTDQELEALQRHWVVVHELSSGQVFMRLYAKR